MSSRPVVLWRSENESIFSQTVAAAASKLNISELAVAKDYWFWKTQKLHSTTTKRRASTQS